MYMYYNHNNIIIETTLSEHWLAIDLGVYLHKNDKKEGKKEGWRELRINEKGEEGR